LIIACVGDISKLQFDIWSSYGLLAEIKKILLTVQSPLFRSLCLGVWRVLLQSAGHTGPYPFVKQRWARLLQMTSLPDELCLELCFEWEPLKK
jgi:hypothetical protein